MGDGNESASKFLRTELLEQMGRPIVIYTYADAAASPTAADREKWIQ
jgi:hypothetical protein